MSRLMRFLPAALLVILAVSSASATPSAAAAADLAYSPTEVAPAPSAGSLVLRLFGMTAFVLTICAGVLWAIRQMSRRHLNATADPARLRVVDEITLNHRCAMQLIQAGDARILIAMDSTGMKTCQLVESEFSSVLAAMERNFSTRETGPTVAEMMALLAAIKRAA